VALAEELAAEPDDEEVELSLGEARAVWLAEAEAREAMLERLPFELADGRVPESTAPSEAAAEERVVAEPETNVAAPGFVGWVVTASGWDVTTEGWPVTTPRELVMVRKEVKPFVYAVVEVGTCCTWPSDIWDPATTEEL
jgi:hypothetical protein